jgi:isopentenyl diphosphate isomerase/L-lactate dehydrogenase-like FMN-dependent dehydrogenase
MSIPVLTGYENYRLVHQACARTGPHQIDLDRLLGKRLQPLLISSMTGGTGAAGTIPQSGY